ncbi:hypothetical protein PsorP6_002264 [Peronosclerospora sorghi]|uniref:Uncharacterized protein n=1 Tax=Peronosclerospora sorghi TaxID=230839 RepID=A0ACC0WSX7_9STRA|nr:hypothetical protein PsorP6_002264 [Peronosclerospora sorghi]
MHKNKAICDLCNSEVNIVLKGTTTNLTQHLRRNHKEQETKIIVESLASRECLEGFLESGGDNHFAMSVLRWIVMTNQPWDVVESRYFNEMVANAKKKGATVPSNNTLEKKLSESIVLECTPFEAPHTGKRINEKLEELLKRYRLGVEKIVSMVSDTCENVKKAGSLMDCEWIGCFNHVLELPVSHFF